MSFKEQKYQKRDRTNYESSSVNRRNQTKKNSHLNNQRKSYSNVNSNTPPSVNFPNLTNDTYQNNTNFVPQHFNTQQTQQIYKNNETINNDLQHRNNDLQHRNNEIIQHRNIDPQHRNNNEAQQVNQNINVDQTKQDDEVYYNPNNRLLTKDFVELTLFNVIGQKFSIHNLHFYQTAFVHASAYKKNIAPPNSKEPLIFLQTYESLEFMGDSWLGAIVTDYLYHRFPGQKEGFLTKVRAKIVREQQLIKFSEQLDFHRYVILPIKAEKMLGRKGSKFLEDVFEAFCAAIIEDLGVAVLQLFIKHMLERNVDFNDLILFDDDYKSMLLQFHQRHGWPHPTYRMIDQEGPGHKKQFVMGVDYIEEFDNIEDLEKPLQFEMFNIKTKNKNGDEQFNECKIFVTGKGKSKKEAEQAASKAALETFGMLV